jgi:uncharacterized membrane protein SpoIIM required for sporulation
LSTVFRRVDSQLTSGLDTLKIIVGRRWIAIAIFFVIEFAIILGVSNSALSQSQLSAYENQYNSITPVLNQTASGQVGAIFANNLRVATLELVPIFGLGVFGLSLYETARIVQVIGIVQKHGVAISLATLFILPSTWLELPAYAIAAAESIYLTYGVFCLLSGRGAQFLRELRFLFVNFVLAVGVLLVAAIFEVTEIQIEQGPPQTQVYALLTWLPFFAVLAGAVAFWRRARRDAPALEEREAAEKAQREADWQTLTGRGPPPQSGEGQPDGQAP